MSLDDDRKRMTGRQARALDPVRARRNADQQRTQTREGGATGVNERGRYEWVPDPLGPLTQNDRGATINFDDQAFAVVPGSPSRLVPRLADKSVQVHQDGWMARPTLSQVVADGIFSGDKTLFSLLNRFEQAYKAGDAVLAAQIAAVLLLIPQPTAGYDDFIHDGTLYTARRFANNVTNVNLGAFTPVAARVYAIPYYVPNNGSALMSKLGIEVTTGLAAANARVLVWTNVNGYPAVKLYESADLSVAGTGYIEASPALLLAHGQLVWVGVEFDTAAAAPVLRGITVNAQSHALGKNALGTASQGAVYFDIAYGSAVNPYPSPPTAVIAGNIPGVYVIWA